MSRYIDLDGVTWDGTPIKTKVMEMETKHGYLQAIGIGWLWGDNVPHIDLEEHDAKVRQDAISFIEKKLLDLELFADNDYWSNNKSMMWKTEEVREILEQLKGEYT